MFFKKLICLATTIMVILSSSLSANANTYSNSAIIDLVTEISQIEEYSEWANAEITFGYELYGKDYISTTGNLYYLKSNDQCKGYIITNSTDDIILEFSNGTPAYDQLNITSSANCKKLYIDGIPAILNGSLFSYLNSDGSLYGTYDINGVMLAYSPQLQGSYNCIVAAISNLLWHWSINGYDELTTNMDFDDVKEEIKSIILAEGGYANDHIPDTIEEYVSTHGYSANVTNKWNPSFNNVKNEVASRPCLLGFAAGVYDEEDGHMTVCINTVSINGGWNYCVVMDGHSTSTVSKLWGDYNDFMAKVVMSD